jgi:hypothetical protein
MWLELLALYEKTSSYCLVYYELAKSYARQWLGPEPICYYLLADGQVVPDFIELPENVKQHTMIYDPKSNKITNVLNRNPEGRFRPLPYLAIRIENDVGNTDLSDWIGDIRANPIPSLSMKQILTLWSLTNQSYVPQDNTTRVYITKNTGEEETIII